MRLLLLVLPSLSCSIVFWVFFPVPVSLVFSVFDLLQFSPMVSQNDKFPYSADFLTFLSFFFFFFVVDSLGLIIWPRLDDPFVSQNLKECCASHFLGRILGRA